jgi:hypothetical protein
MGSGVSSPGASAHGRQAAVHTWISTRSKTTRLDMGKTSEHARSEIVRLGG